MTTLHQLQREIIGQAPAPEYHPGDDVRVHVKIKDGEKTRVQVFEGIIISMRGSGPSATFTVRKTSFGVGVERIFPVLSPSIEKIEIKTRHDVRRAKLYFLRQRAGKSARLKESGHS